MTSNEFEKIEEKIIDIGTHKLRAVITEYPSEYSIILEAGGGEFSDSYNYLQQMLSNDIQTRVISYDRSGWGESDFGPIEFGAKDECYALKKMLEILGISDNLILVGLSYGGYLIQYFTQFFPSIVKGLVLIDPMNVDFVDKFTLEKLNEITPHFNPPKTKSERAGNRQCDQFEESLKFLRGKNIPANIPARLLTAGIAFEPVFWRKSHEDLMKHAHTHKLIIAEYCWHHIVNDYPALVKHTIIELVNSLKT